MKLNLVLKLNNNIKIYCNQLNWVLDYGDKNNRFYYSTLDELCDDLLEIRLVKEVTNGGETAKNIHSLIDSVQNARVEIRNDLEHLKKMMINADRARRKGVFSK